MQPSLRSSRSASILMGLAVALLLSGGGCAHSEFDVVQPGDMAGHVGTKQFASFPWQPLEYQMIASDSHLVIRAYNRSDTPIRLLSEASTVVDPSGQSHPLPLRNQTILPGSYVKLVLPPIRRQVVPTGPSIGIGFGFFAGGYGRGRRAYGTGYGLGYGYDPIYFDRPRYYAVYGGEEEALYWNWPYEGMVRLVLTYRHPPPSAPAAPNPPTTQPGAAGEPGGGESNDVFTHQFVFRSVKF